MSVVPCDNHQLSVLTGSSSCLTRSPPCQVLGPLSDIIQADHKWQERPDHHGHQHPGSPGSKRIKSNVESMRDAAFTLDDMQLRHTLYNTGASALVHLELKDQGRAYALMQYHWTSCSMFLHLCGCKAEMGMLTGGQSLPNCDPRVTCMTQFPSPHYITTAPCKHAHEHCRESIMLVLAPGTSQGLTISSVWKAELMLVFDCRDLLLS